MPMHMFDENIHKNMQCNHIAPTDTSKQNAPGQKIDLSAMNNANKCTISCQIYEQRSSLPQQFITNTTATATVYGLT